MKKNSGIKNDKWQIWTAQQKRNTAPLGSPHMLPGISHTRSQKQFTFAQYLANCICFMELPVLDYTRLGLYSGKRLS